MSSVRVCQCFIICVALVPQLSACVVHTCSCLPPASANSCRQMERSLMHLQGELANIRTGRATPGMLDHLKVLQGLAAGGRVWVGPVDRLRSTHGVAGMCGCFA